MFTFKSVEHFFAKAYQAIVKDTPKVAAALDKVGEAKPEVEALTAVAGQSQVIPLEDAAFAALGALAGFLHAGGAAAAAKLVDAGLDKTAIEKAQAVLAATPQVVAVAKAL